MGKSTTAEIQQSEMAPGPAPAGVLQPEDELALIQGEIEKAHLQLGASHEEALAEEENKKKAKAEHASAEAEWRTAEDEAERGVDSDRAAELSSRADIAERRVRDRARVLSGAERRADDAWKRHGQIAERISALELRLKQKTGLEEGKGILAKSVELRRELHRLSERFEKLRRELESLGAMPEISQLASARSDATRSLNASGVVLDFLR